MPSPPAQTADTGDEIDRLSSCPSRLSLFSLSPVLPPVLRLSSFQSHSCHLPSSPSMCPSHGRMNWTLGIEALVRPGCTLVRPGCLSQRGPRDAAACLMQNQARGRDGVLWLPEMMAWAIVEHESSHPLCRCLTDRGASRPATFFTVNVDVLSDLRSHVNLQVVGLGCRPLATHVPIGPRFGADVH